MGVAAEHARLSFSGAGRWVPCPGSVILCEQYPETETSPAAEEGTRAAALAAQILTTGEVKPDIDLEMFGHLKPYLDSVLPGQLFPGGLHVEETIFAGSIHAHCSGTPDAWALHPESKTAYIWDLKYGYGHVEVFENWQLLAEASAVLDLIDGDHDPHLWKFVLRIVQPRAFHRDGPVRTWAITAGELTRYVRKMREAAEEAIGNNPRTMVGPQCDHCSARHACKALQVAALDARDMADDATPFDLPPEGLALEMRLLRRGQTLMKARLSGLEAQAMSAIRGGVQVPGWTIEHGEGRLNWNKPAAEVLALGALMGIDLAKPVEKAVITPTQAKAAGLDATIVAQYSVRLPGEAKLVEMDTTASRKAFGGNSA